MAVVSPILIVIVARKLVHLLVPSVRLSIHASFFLLQASTLVVSSAGVVGLPPISILGTIFVGLHRTLSTLVATVVRTILVSLGGARRAATWLLVVVLAPPS